MPEVGQVLKYDDPFYGVIDSTTGRHTAKKHKYTDDAVVEEVRLALTLTLTPTLTLTLTLPLPLPLPLSLTLPVTLTLTRYSSPVCTVFFDVLLETLSTNRLQRGRQKLRRELVERTVA